MVHFSRLVSSLLVAASVVTSGAVENGTDHWVNVTSNGETRPVYIHLPPTCATDTQTSCRFFSCVDGATCTGFQPIGALMGGYKCICEPGMCAKGGKCQKADTKTLPLTVSFHPMGLKPEFWAYESNMIPAANEAGHITVYPQGLVPAETVGALVPGWPKGWLEGGYTWGAGSCCPGASRQKIDDVQFTRDLLDALKGGVIKEISGGGIEVDRQRIYAAGGSNGAFLTIRLACQAPELFAAVVPVAAVLANQTRAEYPHNDPTWPFDPFECVERKKPVPMLLFQGTADILVPWIGEPLMGFRTPHENTEVMKALNNIPASDRGAISYANKKSVCTSYGDEANNYTFCEMHNMGHAWPTTGFVCEATQYVPGCMCSTDVDASIETFRFFDKYKLDAVDSTATMVV